MRTLSIRSNLLFAIIYFPDSIILLNLPSERLPLWPQAFFTLFQVANLAGRTKFEPLSVRVLVPWIQRATSISPIQNQGISSSLFLHEVLRLVNDVRTYFSDPKKRFHIPKLRKPPDEGEPAINNEYGPSRNFGKAA